jgi:SMC interacting uncharacterized protein involved in chromosome segregation
MEKKVLTEEEMKQIGSLRTQFDELVFKLGMNEVQQINLNVQKEQLGKELNEIQQLEQNLIKEIETKYGKGNISLETGEFIPVS